MLHAADDNFRCPFIQLQKVFLRDFLQNRIIFKDHRCRSPRQLLDQSHISEECLTFKAGNALLIGCAVTLEEADAASLDEIHAAAFFSLRENDSILRERHTVILVSLGIMIQSLIILKMVRCQIMHRPCIGGDKSCDLIEQRVASFFTLHFSLIHLTNCTAGVKIVIHQPFLAMTQIGNDIFDLLRVLFEEILDLVAHDLEKFCMILPNHDCRGARP